MNTHQKQEQKSAIWSDDKWIIFFPSSRLTSKWKSEITISLCVFAIIISWLMMIGQWIKRRGKEKQRNQNSNKKIGNKLIVPFNIVRYSSLYIYRIV